MPGWKLQAPKTQAKAGRHKPNARHTSVPYCHHDLDGTHGVSSVEEDFFPTKTLANLLHTAAKVQSPDQAGIQCGEQFRLSLLLIFVRSISATVSSSVMAQRRWRSLSGVTLSAGSRT